MASAPITDTVRIIEAGFEDFIARFKHITGNATEHFNRADFHAIQADTKYRLSLYKEMARKIAGWVQQRLGPYCCEKETWQAIASDYQARIKNHPAEEIGLTFFNSVYRKVEVDEHDHDIIFINTNRSVKHSGSPIYRRYWAVRSAEETVRKILNDFAFEKNWEDLERDIKYVADSIQEKVLSKYELDREARVEVLKSPFYRNKSAYLIGRAIIGGQVLPFVMPVLHSDQGLYVDTFIDEPNDVSVIFSFTRSYFLVEVSVPSELVEFLSTLIPLKSRAELYNSIGFNKHGKTVLYHNFLTHLENSNDQFCITPGIKGMVMLVFHLPSYNIVFKLIKDFFEPPKKVTSQEVKSKYKLVSQHDRVGRMADTHEFIDFRFPKDRFDDELLAELNTFAPSLLQFTDTEIIIRHLYTERRMIPLNIYLEQAEPAEAEYAVGEYGNAIKQLAAANIFPGDMLLKNFGVTRHQRVIFYDYDEIVFLTDCNFRRIPKARDDYDELSGDTWYSVGPMDIFPEEFTRFLIGRSEIRKLFEEIHGEIFDIRFWKEMQAKIQNGEIVTVFPYRFRKRFNPKKML